MAKLSDFLGGGGTQKSQIFTSSGTWSHPKPGEIIHVLVGELWSGGGSGASSSGGTNYSGGGGCSGMSSKLISATNNLTINVGAGGQGVSGAHGNDGGYSEVVDSSGNRLVSAGVGERGTRNGSTAGSSGYGVTWTGWDSSGSKSSPENLNSPWGISGANSDEDTSQGTAIGGSAARGSGGDAEDIWNNNGHPGDTGAGGGGCFGGTSGNGGDGVIELFWME